VVPAGVKVHEERSGVSGMKEPGHESSSEPGERIVRKYLLFFGLSRQAGNGGEHEDRDRDD